MGLAAGCLTLAGCAGNHAASRAAADRDTAAVAPAVRAVSQKSINYSAVGTASWYGAGFQGRRTAAGETFDMNSLTAAHPTLPIPCTVRVTNLANRRSLMLRVNDRGPYVGNRLIDVSARSAKALGFYDRGLAKVKVEYVGRAPAQSMPTP